ncbi:hypothetical protein ACJX0J_010350, partial [Zea mays]
LFEHAILSMELPTKSKRKARSSKRLKLPALDDTILIVAEFFYKKKVRLKRTIDDINIIIRIYLLLNNYFLPLKTIKSILHTHNVGLE